MGHSPGRNLCGRQGGEEENQIYSGEMVNESTVQWLLIPVLSGCVAAENSRPHDSSSDSLLATHLSKDQKLWMTTGFL